MSPFSLISTANCVPLFPSVCQLGMPCRWRLLRSVGVFIVLYVDFIRLTGVYSLAGFLTGRSCFVQSTRHLSVQNYSPSGFSDGHQHGVFCHKRREFYLSHLPAYFCDVTKRSMLESPVVFTDSLFCEEEVTRFLDATCSTSLRSQQALVDVASRGPSSTAHQRRFSPRRSPNRTSPSSLCC